MRLALYLAAALPLCVPAAFAETVFALQGTLADGTGTFQGTVGDYGDFPVQGTVTDGAFHFTLPPTYLGETLGEPPYFHIDVFSVNAEYDLSLYAPDTLFSDGGGPLCSLTLVCPSGNAAIDLRSSFSDGGLFPQTAFETLTATPISATPEPGTLLLCGTGVVGLLGAATRRQRAATVA